MQIQSELTVNLLTVDATSNAARASLYDSSGREVSYQSKASFSASGTFTPAATPTDLITISGSATKIIRVASMVIVVTTTAAGSHQFTLLKRSTPDLGGTFVAGTVVPLDSNNTGTAVAGHWTANPTLGTLIGNIYTRQVASPAAIPATWATITKDAGYEMLPWNLNPINGAFLDLPVVLRGVNEQLSINYGGVALVAGQTHAYYVTWTEE